MFSIYCIMYKKANLYVLVVKVLDIIKNNYV